MVSETNPYLWASAAALFAGLAAGQALRAYVPVREGVLRAGRRRPRRTARAVAFLSLGILCLAGLLVFAAKAGIALALSGGPAGSVFGIWSALIFLLAFASGFRPLVVGLPVASVALAALLLIRLALEGWLPLRPAKSGTVTRIASFLPYEVGAASFRGHLELLERDSVPVAQDLSLGSSSIALSIEGLRLSGPLEFLAEFATYRPRASLEAGSGYYRVIGIAAPGGLAQAFAAPAHLRFLDFALPLPIGSGLEPGGEAASLEGVFGLGQRSRMTSAPRPLTALEPVSFGLSVEDSAYILSTLDS